MSEREIDTLIRKNAAVWFKAVDGMLVDMLTGDVLGPSRFDGFGYTYKIPHRSQPQEPPQEGEG